MSTATSRPLDSWPDAELATLAAELVDAWGCWAPTLTADGRDVAFVSDRHGRPQLWVQPVGEPGTARLLELSPDPVLAVHWSPDGAWLAVSVASGGGVRSEVWVVRPDGRDARRVAGGDSHAVLGPWSRSGHELVVTISSDQAGEPNRCVLLDPATGAVEPLATGGLVNVLDLSGDTRFALLRDGTRGAQFCRVLDREADVDLPVLPYESIGSTDAGMLRPAPATWSGSETMVCYLVTDAGMPRRALLASGIRPDGHRTTAGVMAERDDADLEYADADAAGHRILLVWNVHGRSEIEVLDTRSGARVACSGLTGEVVTGGVLARDGHCAVVSAESAQHPRRLWRIDTADGSATPVTPPSLHRPGLVEPELVEFEAHDGLPLSGWLYRAVPGAGPAGAPGPGMLSLHGGPEAQERPSFSPQHQLLAAAGITVFAPNIRGSSGFGRAFMHADDRWGRFDALADVASCAAVLSGRGGADPARIAVTGRSYGGYLTLLALVHQSPLYAAGVDICGMSDLLTFYRDTEAWIAAAAVTKYGDPVADAALLAEISPLHRAEVITAPLLVVHGELDTNVPVTEARAIVARLRELGRPVEYLELPGEGHEYRRADSKLLLLRGLAAFLTGVLG